MSAVDVPRQRGGIIQPGFGRGEKQVLRPPIGLARLGLGSTLDGLLDPDPGNALIDRQGLLVKIPAAWVIGSAALNASHTTIRLNCTKHLSSL